jgi:integrase
MFAVNHIISGLGTIALKKLHPQQIQEFLPGKLTSLSVTSCKHLRTGLKVAFNWAVENNLIARNPANSKLIRPPKIEHHVRFMTIAELGAFRAASRGNWMEHALNLALATGIREAEVLGLQWERLDLEKRVARIEVQLQRIDGELVLTEPKTKKSRRTIRLNEDAVRALAARKIQQEGEKQASGDTWKESGFVFTNRDTGAPMDQRTLVKYFYKARDAAGVKGLTFHGLRHTYASVLLARGTPIKDVSENLGHSDVAFYGHCMPDFRDKAANEMQRRRSRTPIKSSARRRPRRRSRTGARKPPLLRESGQVLPPR